MKLVVFSNSASFGRFLREQLDRDFEVRSRLQAPRGDPEGLYLLHLSSMKRAGLEWMAKQASEKDVRFAVCSDRPGVAEMLDCVHLGARAYCNSHMAATHYHQMLRLLAQGQSWFPPKLLDESFALARRAVRPDPPAKLLQGLTAREREIALAVSEGNSNRQVAELYSISEATVKTHLTSIFKKLEVRDRVSLALLLRRG